MISKVHANTLLNATVGNVGITKYTAVYLGLCSSEPNHDTGAVASEPTAASYERKNVTGMFAMASGGIVKNIQEIQFKTAREAFGTMNYWFLSNGSSGAAMIWGTINDGAGVDIGAETVPVFYENELRASIDVALA